jgi:hypothetical protein
MGQISAPRPVKLFVGMLAQRTDFFKIAQKELSAEFGPIDTASDVMSFHHTDYYED